MANTTFIDNSTVIVADWCNDVNDTVYEILGDGTNTPTTAAQARTNLDVPANDGTGASGTWGINITGNAATATTATSATSAATATTAVTVSGSLADGVVATTQTADDNSTKVATTAYTDTAVANSVTIETSQNASGTAVLFTSVPADAKRVTILFNGVSSNGTNGYLVQLGNTTFTTSGYVSLGCRQGSSTTVETSSTAGFLILSASATNSMTGSMVLNLFGSNTWISTHGLISTAGGIANYNGAGSLSLGAVLDRIQITTVGGTDTFDAGSITLIYE